VDKIGRAYRAFVGNPEAERPLGRHRYGWEDDIKLVIKEKGYEIVYCIHHNQDRAQWQALTNKVIISDSIKCWEVLQWLSDC
jgi:hypothetical protein